MSGKLKEVRGRIQSVMSTQQITKAMKMVSAAKLRKAQDRIVKMRPYVSRLSTIMSNIMAAQDGEMELALADERSIEKVLMVVVTSDRGLCGSFNANVIKATIAKIKADYADQHRNGNVDLMCIGKKGHDYFSSREFNINKDHLDIFHDISFDRVAEAANEIMDSFINGSYDKVEVVYAQFKNAATQVFEAEAFLPLSADPVDTAEEENKTNADFIYEPSRELIIQELIPKILKTQLFKAVLESNASEHGARMTAMDKASENANEMLGDLRKSYNQARQAAITTELSEIVGGAAALEEG